MLSLTILGADAEHVLLDSSGKFSSVSSNVFSWQFWNWKFFVKGFGPFLIVCGREGGEKYALGFPCFGIWGCLLCFHINFRIFVSSSLEF